MTFLHNMCTTLCIEQHGGDDHEAISDISLARVSQVPVLLPFPRLCCIGLWAHLAWQQHRPCLSETSACSRRLCRDLELNLLGRSLGLLPVALGGRNSTLVGLVHASLGIGEGLVDGLGGSLGS